MEMKVNAAFIASSSAVIVDVPFVRRNFTSIDSFGIQKADHARPEFFTEASVYIWILLS